jgi:hypothetical protein
VVRIKAAIKSGSLIPIVDLNKFDLIDFIGNSGKTFKLQAAIVTHVVRGHRRLKNCNFLPIPSENQIYATIGFWSLFTSGIKLKTPSK